MTSPPLPISCRHRRHQHAARSSPSALASAVVSAYRLHPRSYLPRGRQIEDGDAQRFAQAHQSTLQAPAACVVSHQPRDQTGETGGGHVISASPRSFRRPQACAVSARAEKKISETNATLQAGQRCVTCASHHMVRCNRSEPRPAGDLTRGGRGPAQAMLNAE